MTRNLIVFVVLISIYSCNKVVKENTIIDESEISTLKNNDETPYEKIKKSISTELLKIMHDPESFEFVNLVITDTFSVKNRRELMTDEFINEIKKNPYSSEQLLTLINKLQPYLQDQTDENKDAIYYTEFQCRGKNKLGAKVLNTYVVTILNDENFSVLMLKD